MFLSILTFRPCPSAHNAFTTPPPPDEYDDYNNGIEGFSARYRFSGMPYPEGSPDNVDYFSYNAGPLHVISLASFFPDFSASSGMTLFLEADLKAVDRAVTPWIVVEIHAPWYNSNTQHTNDGKKMRTAYEALLNQYGASIFIAGHVHAYERSCPALGGACVEDGAAARHFTCGDGGASLYTKWVSPTPAWSEFRSAQFGHCEVTFFNSTWARLDWIRNADKEPVAADSVMIKNVGL